MLIFFKNLESEVFMGSGNHIPTDNLSARLTLYNNKKNKINMLILTSLSLLRILASRDNPKL